MLVIKPGHFMTVDSLLNNNASVNEEDIFEDTAWIYANVYKHNHIAQLLKIAGVEK
jgi:ankyrin repeat protein